MTGTQYGEYQPAAGRLALVRAGGRRLQRRLSVGSKKARADLARMKEWWSPNIAGFGFGPKEPGAKPGRRVVVRFYVWQKVHESRISSQERIPPVIVLDELAMEIATDVIQLDAPPVFHADLRAGSEIAHLSGSFGTVSCYVRKKGSPSPLMLSCAHVLAPFDAAENDQVESPVDANSQMADNPVGRVTDGGIFLKPNATHPTDAALARPIGVTPSNQIPLSAGFNPCS